MSKKTWGPQNVKVAVVPTIKNEYAYCLCGGRTRVKDWTKPFTCRKCKTEYTINRTVNQND